MNKIPVQVFEHLFSERHEDSKWHITQAITLLTLGTERKAHSLIVYAALEMRLAIEQELFRVIRLGSNSCSPKELLARCRKKDGLFRELERVEPSYTKICFLMRALSEEIPVFPKVANWDIKQLRKHWQSLSGICHSPQTLDSKLTDRWLHASDLPPVAVRSK